MKKKTPKYIGFLQVLLTNHVVSMIHTFFGAQVSIKLYLIIYMGLKIRLIKHQARSLSCLRWLVQKFEN
jgi:small basic protein